MYSCGPTVYRYAHVGNLRTFLLADLIRRVAAVPRHRRSSTSRTSPTSATCATSGSTAGEDRMLVAAGLEDKTPGEIADAYEAAFHADAARLNILPAHVFPRATEHVPEMLALAERLVDTGHAYVATPATSTTRRVVPGLRRACPGTRSTRCGPAIAARSSRDKRDPADFALWKAAGEGRMLKWPTAVGRGLPGLAPRVLGDGACGTSGRGSTCTPAAIDNVFPHHEDEIAQSAPLVGGPPARTGSTASSCCVGGKKMAKSAGNFDRITELAERGIDPLAFRYLCADRRAIGTSSSTPTSRWRPRRPALASLRAGLAALGPRAGRRALGRAAVLRAGAAPARPSGSRRAWPATADGRGAAARRPRPRAGRALADAGRALHDRFVAAIDDDLDLPAALAVVRETLRADLPADERRWLVLDADFVLGLDLDRAAAVARRTPPRAPTASRRASTASPVNATRRGRRATSPAPTPSGRSWPSSARGDRRSGRPDRRRRLRSPPISRSQQVAPRVRTGRGSGRSSACSGARAPPPRATSSRGARGGSPGSGPATARRGAVPSPSSRRTRLHQMSRFR